MQFYWRSGIALPVLVLILGACPWWTGNGSVEVQNSTGTAFLGDMNTHADAGEET